MDLLAVDTEVFESLHMPCCEIKLISTLIFIGCVKTFSVDWFVRFFFILEHWLGFLFFLR